MLTLPSDSYPQKQAGKQVGYSPWGQCDLQCDLLPLSSSGESVEDQMGNNTETSEEAPASNQKLLSRLVSLRGAAEGSVEKRVAAYPC